MEWLHLESAAGVEVFEVANGAVDAGSYLGAFEAGAVLILKEAGVVAEFGEGHQNPEVAGNIEAGEADEVDPYAAAIVVQTQVLCYQAAVEGFEQGLVSCSLIALLLPLPPSSSSSLMQKPGRLDYRVCRSPAVAVPLVRDPIYSHWLLMLGYNRDPRNARNQSAQVLFDEQQQQELA